MKKILLYLLAILTPFIFISGVNAEIIYPSKIYPSGLGAQDIQHVIINDSNWYGYNGSHSAKKWAWEYQLTNFDSSMKYDISGIILNQTTPESLSSATITFNDKACTLNYSFNNNEILWSDMNNGNTYGNEFNYFSYGNMTSFTCENVEIDSVAPNYFNVYFGKNTTATFINPLRIVVNSSSLSNSNQKETNDKLQDSINKQQEIKQEQEKTNQELGKLNDNLTNSDSPDNMGGLSNSAGWLPAGPIDSILNLPLSMLNNISDNLNKSCQPVNLPLPFVNKNLPLPCLTSIYSQIDGIGPWITTISVIASAFILFSYLIKLYKWVDDTLTFRENNYIDNWGGL